MNIDGLDNPWFRYWPHRPVELVIDPLIRDSYIVMEELRETDPDGHACLSEHIVLPERNTGTEPS